MYVSLDSVVIMLTVKHMDIGQHVYVLPAQLVIQLSAALQL